MAANLIAFRYSAPPSYSGGRSYAGGASTSYASGARTPGGISPSLIRPAALGFFPGIWLYGAYAYPYGNHYNYHNDTTNRNESLPVECLCQQYQPCGCDDTGDNSTIAEVLKNGSTAQIANVNGTRTIVINGSLPNGTDTGNGDVGSSGSANRGTRQRLLEGSGYWLLCAVVGLMVWTS